jgi:hypothetical protein
MNIPADSSSKLARLQCTLLKYPDIVINLAGGLFSAANMQHLVVHQPGG